MPSNSREPNPASQSSPEENKKPSMEYLNEPSGSSTRSAVHRRKSSMNLQKTQSIAIKSDPKPSRSQGESSAKRKEQNRIAQRAFRKRQKAHLEELEAEVIEKGMRIREITENNGLLLETMKQLQTQNVELKSSRAPNMSGFSQPQMNPTRTPLTTERSARNILPNPTQPSRSSPRSRSEHGWSSSTDSPESNTSSPEVTSPATLHSTSLGSDLHIGSLTGLQLSLTPGDMSGRPLPPVAGNSQYGVSTKSPPMQGQVYRQYANPQQWTTENSPQGFSQGSHMHNAALSNNPPRSNKHQLPLENRPQNKPGPMARRYSDAITQQHKHSTSDPRSISTAAHRPHTSISSSHPNLKSAYHHHSLSVPNRAFTMTNGSPQMVFTSAFEASPMQPSYPGAYTPEQILHGQPIHQQHHVMYHQPVAHSSSSSSNVGWSFSPLSQSASFTSVDQAGDYSRSSAPYFSALSLQASGHSAMASDDIPAQLDAQAIAAGAMSDHWADMMPSMGATTPLPELSDNGYINNTGTAPVVTEPQHRQPFNTDSPFLSETGVLAMHRLDMDAELSFSPFHSGQFFSSPAG